MSGPATHEVQLGSVLLVLASVCGVTSFVVLRARRLPIIGVVLLVVAGALAVFGLAHLLPGLFLSDKGG